MKRKVVISGKQVVRDALDDFDRKLFRPDGLTKKRKSGGDSKTFVEGDLSRNGVIEYDLKASNRPQREDSALATICFTNSKTSLVPAKGDQHVHACTSINLDPVGVQHRMQSRVLMRLHPKLNLYAFRDNDRPIAREKLQYAEPPLEGKMSNGSGIKHERIDPVDHETKFQISSSRRARGRGRSASR